MAAEICKALCLLIGQRFAVGEAVAGANLLNQPINERMLEHLLAGEWQVTGAKCNHMTAPACLLVAKCMLFQISWINCEETGMTPIVSAIDRV